MDSESASTDRERTLQAAIGDLTMTLGVCGSISSVAAPHMVAWLKSEVGVGKVNVVLTRSAQRFVALDAIRCFGAGDVLTDDSGWDRGGASHIGIAEESDVVVIAPATAHTVAKLAHGLCDNVLTQTVLAAQCPIVVAPVMNQTMLSKPATRRNLSVLEDDGLVIRRPQSGPSVTTARDESGSMVDFRSLVLEAITLAIKEKKDDR